MNRRERRRLQNEKEELLNYCLSNNLCYFYKEITKKLITFNLI